MNSSLVLATCALALFSTGCLHPKMGPKSLPRDRAAYSTGVAESWKEQMLLNVVKMRYMDAPTFVDVGNIVVSYTLTQTASVGATVNSSAGTASENLGVGGVFSNTPTITYTPLTGSKFIQGLLTPLPPAAVFGAIQNGTAADSMMLSTVVSINGLKNQQSTLNGISPADPAFDQVRALVRKVQLSGGVRTYVKPDPNKGPVSVVALRQANLTPETLANIKELRGLLKLNPDAEEFSLVQAAVSSSDTEIAMLTRSIVSIMQNMAADVEVPAEDLAKNYAFRGYEGRDPGIRETARMIRIHSGKQRSAEAFVAVKYEGNWFWIDKGDLSSKQVFLQLMILFTMADTSPREPPPVVTIPSR
jgi:hypothetical protein